MSGDKRKKSTGILSFFKRVSRELTESERGESVSDIDEHETHESFEAVSSEANAAKVIKPKKRSFQEAWKSDFSWLVYDETSDTMYCDVCKKAGPEIAGKSEFVTSKKKTTMCKTRMVRKNPHSVLQYQIRKYVMKNY